jgi:hypothetical protein
MDQLVPAAFIVLANVLSGPHSSLRWEIGTAIFGWTAGITMITWSSFFLLGFATLASYSLQVFSFALLTVVSRDYERVLKPVFEKIFPPR